MMCHSLGHTLRLSLALTAALLSFTWPVVSASGNGKLFPVGADSESLEWSEISPAEAVQFVEDAMSKQTDYRSGKIRVLVYLAEPTLDRAELIECFQGLKSTDSPEKLREATAKVRPDVKDFVQKWNWSEATILQDGANVMERCAKWSDDSWSSTYLKSDMLEILYNEAQRQADVSLPGESRQFMYTVSSFAIPLYPLKREHLIAAAQTDDFVKIVRGSQRGPARTTIVSRKDGGVRYDVVKMADGTLSSETWQGPLKEAGGDDLYPTSWLKIDYRAGSPSLVEAAAIQNAEFDVQIEASEFSVAIPSGTTIVDLRDGGPFVGRVDEAIDDLAAAIDILRDSGFLRDRSQR